LREAPRGSRNPSGSLPIFRPENPHWRAVEAITFNCARGSPSPSPRATPRHQRWREHDLQSACRDVSRGPHSPGDGLIELSSASTSNSVLCKVVNGGELGEHKGINLPGVKLRIPAVTRGSRRLAFALRHGANFIGGQLRPPCERCAARNRPSRARGKNFLSSPA